METQKINSPMLRMIPMANHADGNRQQMARAMLAQYTQTESNEVPLIKTPSMKNIIYNSGFFVKKAQHNGLLQRIHQELYCVIYDNDDVEVFEYHPYMRYINPLPNDGDSINISKGDLIMVHDSVTENFNLKYGFHMNVIAGGLGYTFEDAFAIDETHKKLTSSKIISVDFIVKRNNFIVNTDLLKVGNTIRIHDWIIKEYNKALRMLGSPTEIIRSEETFKITRIHTMLTPQKKPHVTNQSTQDLFDQHTLDNLYDISVVDEKYRGRVKKELNSGFKSDKVAIIRIFGEKKYEFNEGDKLANNWGNKGVCIFLKQEDMIKMFLKQGIDLEGFKPNLMFNPLGVHSRMNPAQLAAMHLNYLLKYSIPEYIYNRIDSEGIGIEVIDSILNEITEELVGPINDFQGRYIELKSVLSHATYDQKMEAIADIEKINGVELYLDYIQDNMILKVYNLMKHWDPWYFEKTKEVGFGVMYMMKLDHIAESKLNSTSANIYSRKNKQPIEGQKMGEMEVWNLIAHGAESFLYSVLSIKSDEHVNKRLITDRIIENGSASLDDIQLERTPSSQGNVQDLLKIIRVSI